MTERTRLKFTHEGIVEAEPSCTLRTSCRACEGPLSEVLDLGDQYLPRFPKEIDLSLPMTPLELMRCDKCGLLQLRHTVNPDLVFREYWYRTSINGTMMRAMQDMVADGCAYHRRGKWVDIGANDGYTLSQVPHSFERVACEPALNLAETLKPNADLVVSDYFMGQEAFEKANVITSAAMFYDLEDPATFVRNIVKCLNDDGIWINQLNDAPTMLEKNDFSAICHEHLCYYDVPSLKKLYNENGLDIINLTHNDVNGGSIRITAIKSGRAKPIDLSRHKSVSEEDAELFARRVKKWKRNMQVLLRGITAPIWVYGASTKGIVMLQYLESNDSFFAVADRNPAKHGLYMAGPWLPITDEQTMRNQRPEYVFMLPWSFEKEFTEREAMTRERGATLLYPLPNIKLVL